MFVHIFPNTLSLIFLSLAGSIGGLMLSEATLSFLKLGVQPPTPSWGGIMLDGKNYITSSWWLTVWPGLAIVVTSLSLVLIGDGLQSRSDAMRSREGDQ